MQPSITVFLFIAIFLVQLKAQPIPLSNGETYTSILYSDQTIVFSYIVSDACNDLIIVSTGDGDIWVSRTEEIPHVYGYTSYVFTCDGDYLKIPHVEKYDSVNSLYYIGAYLDHLIYDKYTNLSITVREEPTTNKISPNVPLTLQDQIVNAGQSSTFEMCAAHPSITMEFDIPSEVMVEISKYPLDSHLKQQTFKRKLPGGINTFNLTSLLDEQFTEGNYYVTITSDTNISYNVTAYQIEETSQTQPDQTVIPLTSDQAVNGNLGVGGSAYYSLVVDHCEDAEFLLDGMLATSNADLYISYSQFPDAHSFGWRTVSPSATTEQITVWHTDPTFKNGTIYVHVYCDPDHCADGTSYVLRALKSLGNDTLTSTFLFRASGTAPADVIDWYSACIPTIDTGINITTITTTLDGELIDVLASRVPYFEKNYTKYLESAVPNWNMFANWEYKFRPYPYCKSSFFLNKDDASGAYSPGMIYIGVYSFCLNSCNYCHGDIDYTVEISQSTSAILLCDLPPSTTTTEQESVAFYRFPSYLLASLLVALLLLQN